MLCFGEELMSRLGWGGEQALYEVRERRELTTPAHDICSPTLLKLLVELLERVAKDEFMPPLTILRSITLVGNHKFTWKRLLSAAEGPQQASLLGALEKVMLRLANRNVTLSNKYLQSAIEFLFANEWRHSCLTNDTLTAVTVGLVMAQPPRSPLVDGTIEALAWVLNYGNKFAASGRTAWPPGFPRYLQPSLAHPLAPL